MSKSVKNVSKKNREAGQRTKVNSVSLVPKDWPDFLRNKQNKEELFQFLTIQCINEINLPGKELNITYQSSVMSHTRQDNLNSIEPCNHEEADTRIILHLSDAVNQGYQKVVIRTVDTDILIIALAFLHKLPELKELWIHVGTGNNQKFISCHSLATALGPEKAEVLPIFHAFTGCDTVSFFNGKGKKTAFETWNAYPEATSAFQSLMNGKWDEAEDTIQKFEIKMYDRSSTCQQINDCRKQLFSKKDRQLENLPPTKNALRQHALRAAYQSIVWRQALEPMQDLPSPSSWGWRCNGEEWSGQTCQTCQVHAKCKYGVAVVWHVKHYAIATKTI